MINLGGFMACGIGLFLTTPYILILCAVTYLAMMGPLTTDPYAKGEPLTELEIL